MAAKIKKTLYFPNFKLIITSNNREVFNLVIGQFPESLVGKRKGSLSVPHLTIRMFLHKTKYSKLPRSPFDCFRGFTLFYNKFADSSRINLDVGPRTLRTIVDPRENTIESFIATPPDIGKDLLFDLIFFQPLKCLLECHHLFLLHASCVTKNNKGVLFSGQSGSGKSMLSLALIKKGFDYLSDDEVIVKRKNSKVEVFSFPSLPKISKKLLPFFPEFRGEISRNPWKKEKMRINISKVLSDQIRNNTQPRLLIFPKYTKTLEVRAESMKKKAVLNRLVRAEFMYVKSSMRHVSAERFRIFAELLNQVDVYKLYYNDSHIGQAVDIVDQLLNNKS